VNAGASSFGVPAPGTGRIVGIGVDAVDVERFRTALERTPTMRDRLFVASELADLADRADQVPGLAARFAAREAVMKALGVGLGAFGFHDVWVARSPGGAPHLVVEGAAQDLATGRGVRNWHLSITHTAAIALAYVVAE
jgi:holo-[acyl-carrier protein] synthase